MVRIPTKGSVTDSGKELTADCGCIFVCTPYYRPDHRKPKSGPDPPDGYYWLRAEDCEGHSHVGNKEYLEFYRRVLVYVQQFLVYPAIASQVQEAIGHLEEIIEDKTRIYEKFSV